MRDREAVILRVTVNRSTSGLDHVNGRFQKSLFSVWDFSNLGFGSSRDIFVPRGRPASRCGR